MKTYTKLLTAPKICAWYYLITFITFNVVGLSEGQYKANILVKGYNETNTLLVVTIPVVLNVTGTIAILAPASNSITLEKSTFIGKTKLYQNYPNPFNPETWIPYQLKGESEVKIMIYSLSGQLIRTLELGNKQHGLYLSRDIAAYWDGRNESGEQVTSGIYFYTIKAGNYTATMKMIVKNKRYLTLWRK